MKSRTIVITGGTGGIGFQTASALAAVDEKAHTIVITGRSQGSAEKAVAAIKEATGNDKIHYALADMSLQAQVKALVKELLERFPKIDELISNAGNLSLGDEVLKSKEGVELNLAVNVLSHMILLRGLVPALSNGGKVQMISGGSPMDKLNVDDLESKTFATNLNRYGHSKKILEALALALAKEVAPKGITINVVGGGAFAASSMTGAMSWSDMPWYMKLMYPLIWFLQRPDKGKSANKAAQPNIWAAQQSAEELGSGTTYWIKAPTPSVFSPEVADEGNQQKVLRFAESHLL